MGSMRKRQIEFVMKISKYCNLRCSYCYEFNELSDTSRLSLASFGRMLDNMKGHAGRNWERICFIWHGGEPLLIKPAYYEQLGALQREKLGEDVVYWNFTQSNLTALGDQTLDFVEQKRFFKGVGVSVDPFGTERVDMRGRPTNETVFKNMQRLRDRNYDFACITVLTPKSLPFVSQTFNFFDTLGTQFRVLPYDFSASDDQAKTHTLTAEQHVAALTTLFDLWLSSPGRLRIDPIYEYMIYAMKYRNKVEKQYWDMWRDEAVFTVELDGALWGRPTAYEPDEEYGNIIEQDLETILDSDKRRIACEESVARIETYCGTCPYYGYCPGKYVGNSTNIEQALFAKSGCWVRKVIDHIVEKLDEIGIDTGTALAEMPAVQDNSDLSIAIANA
jgi:uncharacterized protein